MQAVVFQKGLRVETNYPPPEIARGWALLKVIQAGICRTDIEITHGYMDFQGVPGHEFVAYVADCEEESWIDQRMVGEINVGCGVCDACRSGWTRHCPRRRVLGIAGLDGCLAEYCALPIANLHRVPDDMTDDEAVFVEPLAAAYEILDQVPVRTETRCLILGDGKLGILCAWVLSTVSRHVELVGRHPEKLALAEWNGVRARRNADSGALADLVVEATGRPEGFAAGVRCCKPRGLLVLKSTLASRATLDLTPVVLNEITVIGSRCGRFEAALAGWARHRFPLSRLIAARYSLSDAVEAFERAQQPGVLKVLVDISGSKRVARSDTL